MKKLSLKIAALLLVSVMAFSVVACAVDDALPTPDGATPPVAGNTGGGIQITGESVTYTEETKAAFTTAVLAYTAPTPAEGSTQPAPSPEYIAEMTRIAEDSLDIIARGLVSEDLVKQMIALMNHHVDDFLRWMSLETWTTAELDAVKALYTEAANLIGASVLGQVMHGFTLEMAELFSERCISELLQEALAKQSEMQEYMNGVEGYERTYRYYIEYVTETTIYVQVREVDYKKYSVETDMYYDHNVYNYRFIDVKESIRDLITSEMLDFDFTNIGYPEFAITRTETAPHLSSSQVREQYDATIRAMVDSYLDTNKIDEAAVKQGNEIISALQTANNKVKTYVTTIKTSDFVTMTNIALTLANVTASKVNTNQLGNLVLNDFEVTEEELIQLIMDNKDAIRDLNPGMASFNALVNATEAVLGVSNAIAADVDDYDYFKNAVNMALVLKTEYFDTIGAATPDVLNAVLELVADAADLITADDIHALYTACFVRGSTASNGLFPDRMTYTLYGKTLTGDEAYAYKKNAALTLVKIYRNGNADIKTAVKSLAKALAAVDEFAVLTHDNLENKESQKNITKLDAQTIEALLNVAVNLTDLTDAEWETLLKVAFIEYRYCHIYNGTSYVTDSAYYNYRGERMTRAQNNVYEKEASKVVLKHIFNNQTAIAAESDEVAEVVMNLGYMLLQTALLGTNITIPEFDLTAAQTAEAAQAVCEIMKGVTDEELEAMFCSYTLVYDSHDEDYNNFYVDETGKQYTEEERYVLESEACAAVFKRMLIDNGAHVEKILDIADALFPQAEALAEQIVREHYGTLPELPTDIPNVTRADVIDMFETIADYTAGDELINIYAGALILREYFITNVPYFCYFEDIR